MLKRRLDKLTEEIVCHEKHLQWKRLLAYKLRILIGCPIFCELQKYFSPEVAQLTYEYGSVVYCDIHHCNYPRDMDECLACARSKTRYLDYCIYKFHKTITCKNDVLSFHPDDVDFHRHLLEMRSRDGNLRIYYITSRRKRKKTVQHCWINGNCWEEEILLGNLDGSWRDKKCVGLKMIIDRPRRTKK